MERLQKLYDLYLSKGLISESIDIETFAGSNSEQIQKLYDLGKDNGLFQTTDINQFSLAWPEKKNQNVTGTGTVQQEDTGSTTPAIQQDGSLVSGDNKNVTSISLNSMSPKVRAYDVNLDAPYEEERLTAFEKTFGENEFTDFFGDMGRAWSQGQAQGATIDDAINVWSKGNEITDKELEEYIKASANMDASGTSDEMKDFNYIYEKEGGGVSGFILGLIESPTVVPQLFLSSISSMVNPTVGGAALAGAGSGAIAGGAAGSFGGALAAFTAGGGAIAGGIGAAGTMLEAGLSFTEFLKEELQKKNLPFTKEGIRKILADEEAMTSIQNRALGRGITIGAIDALSGGLASKVTTSVAKGVGKGLGRKLVAAGAGGTVEAVGGGAGEIGGRLVAGQEMDVAEIGFEAVTGSATAPLTVGKGLYDASGYKMVGGKLVKPQYKLNNEPVDKAEIEKRIKTATPEELAGMNIDIKNDNALSEEVKDIQSAHQFSLDIDKKIQGADKVTIIALEVEKSKIGDSKNPVNAQKINKINDQINKILEKYEGAVSKSVDITAEDGAVSSEQITVTKQDARNDLEKQGVTNPTDKQIADQQLKMFEEAKSQLESESQKNTNLVTEEKAVEELKKEGIENPTAEQIKQKQDAIQESSTESLDVQEPTRDGETLGKRDTEGVIAEQSSKKDQDATQETAKEEVTIEEEITPTETKVITSVVEEITESNNKRNPKNKNETTLGVIEDVKNSGQYNSASPGVKNKIIKAINKALDIKITPPAIPKKSTIQTKIDKTVSKKPDTKRVTTKTTEYKALKKELKTQEDAAKKGVKAYSKAASSLGGYVKKLAKAGKITVRQSAAMANKILKTNLLNKKAVENLNTYIEKIFNNVEIADKIYNTKRKLKNAKGNIKSKIGTSKDIGPVLKQLFALNPLAIPLNKLDTYVKIVDEFSARKKILNLSDKSKTLKEATDILNSIETEVDNTDKSSKTQKEVKNYDVKKAAKEISKDKLTTEELNSFELNEDKDIAEGINDLTPSDIENLAIETDGTVNISKLEELKGVKQNLKDGYVTKLANDLLRTIKAQKEVNKINPLFKKIKDSTIASNIASAYTSIRAMMKGKSLILEKIRRNSLFQIDHVLGNYNSKAIYNATLGKLASSYSVYETEVKKLQNKINDAYNLVAYDRAKGGGVLKRAGIKRNQNDIVKSNYKIRLLQLAREHVSNIVDGKANPKAASALKFAEATIAAIKDNQASLSDMDAKILQGLVDEFKVDGEISISKLENSLTPNEKKALEIYDEVNSSLADKAIFTSATLRGNKIDILNNYSHHVVVGNAASLQTEYDFKKSKFNQTSTKAGTLVERTPGVKPISFDPALSASLGVSETLLDYHMTDPIKEVFQTLEILKKSLKNDSLAKDGAVKATEAVEIAITEALDNVFGNQFQQIESGMKLFNAARRIGYQTTLASLPRAAAELASNASFAFAMDAAAISEGKPPPFINGVKKYGRLSIDSVMGSEILKNLGSVQTDKLYNITDGTGKMLDFSESKSIDRGAGTAMETKGVFGGIKKVINESGVDDAVSLPYKLTDYLSNKLLSTPDQAISRPLWYETFANKFQEITGEKITAEEYKKIGEGKSKFLSKEYASAIKESRQSADATSIQMATTTNPFSKILNLELNSSNVGLIDIVKTANSFMSNFIINEYSTARAAVTALFVSGDISRPQAAGLMVAVSTRMVSYMLLYDMFQEMFDTALGAEEKEDDQEIKNKAEGQFIGSIATLALRGTKGNLPMIPINYGIEYINRTGDYGLGKTDYFEELRDFEQYDPFIHSIVFNQISSDDLEKKSLEELSLKSLAGPYGPMLKSATRTYKLLKRVQSNTISERQRQSDLKELKERMLLLELPGNLGLLPGYKDIRRIYLKEFFKDIGKKRGGIKTKVNTSSVKSKIKLKT